jgi:Flp pilus assembly protein TadG
MIKNHKILDFDNQDGATLVEFSMVVGFLLFFLLITASFVVFLHASMSLEHALGVTARQVVATGTTVSGGVDYGNRIDAIKNDVIRRARGFDGDGDGNSAGLVIDPGRIYICRAKVFNRDARPPCPADNAGEPGQTVVLYAEKPINAGNYLFWPDGIWGPAPGFTVGSSVIIRNEPFS